MTVSSYDMSNRRRRVLQLEVYNVGLIENSYSRENGAIQHLTLTANPKQFDNRNYSLNKGVQLSVYVYDYD